MTTGQNDESEKSGTGTAGEDIALLGVAMPHGSITTLDFTDSAAVTIENGS